MGRSSAAWWLGTMALVAACGGDADDPDGSGGAGAVASSSTAASAAGASSAAGGSGGSIPPPPSCGPPDAPAGFFASPDGSAAGDGSLGQPWDIATALVDPPGVSPGDTIWLRGGAYAGAFVVKLDGTEQAPITVRSYPGEWAVLDGAGTDEPVVQIYRAHTVLRDLEVTNTSPDRTTSRPSGIYVEGDHHQLVNLVVHDVGTGVIANSASADFDELAPELTVYGCVFYDNGWMEGDTGHGHHVYLQNRDGTKHLLDNVLWGAFGFGFHLYSDTDTYYAEGYEVRGNVSFQNGAAGPGADSKLYDNFMVGHAGTHPVRRVELSENFGWALGTGERQVRLGWNAANEDAALHDNYFVGQTIFQPSWQSLVLTGNTFIGELVGSDAADHPDNLYLDVVPTENVVFVRPNAHAPGRAHVVVYNWQGLDTVDVDLAAALAPGSVFELRHVMDLAAPPVASGTWEGGPVSVPMADLPVAQPIGVPDGFAPAELPGKAFAVFVLLGCEPG